MPPPDQPAFHPERVDEETVRTHFLEISGELAKADLTAEIDLRDSWVQAAYYHRERRLLPMLTRDGHFFVYSSNDLELPPRELFQFDTRLGLLRHAAIGPLYDEETAAAVVPASTPDQVALIALTEGGQFMNPEVMNVFGLPDNVELAEPTAVTAVDFRPPDHGSSDIAIAYGPDVIVHHPGARPGRGIMTEREREANHAELERLTEQIHGRPYAEVAAEIEERHPLPDHNPDSLNVYRQKLHASYHRRLPERIVSLSLGNHYGSHGYDALYALGESGRAWTLGIDYELCGRTSWPNPDQASIIGEFTAEGAFLNFVEQSSIGGILTGGGGELSQTFPGYDSPPISALRVAAQKEVCSIQSTPRHTLIGTRETTGPGGTLTVLDRHPGFPR